MILKIMLLSLWLHVEFMIVLFQHGILRHIQPEELQHPIYTFHIVVLSVIDKIKFIQNILQVIIQE